jgi:hypothetical protein
MFTNLVSRALIASGLVLGAVATFSPATLAATTATVNLAGSVASTLAITSSTAAGASALALQGTGTAGVQTIVKAADVAIDTNNSTGYTLTATSGNLVNATTTTPIAYQVTSVADAAAAPGAGGFTAASGTNYTVASDAAGPVPKDLYIMYTPAQFQDPGTYTAIITLTVADN